MEDNKSYQEKVFQEVMNRQVNLLRKSFLLIFGIIGLIFFIAGVIILLSQGKLFKLFQLGLAYGVIGLVFLLVAILCFLLIPKNRQYNYERFKKRIQKYGLFSTIDMTIMVSILSEKITQLENTISELEKKIKE